MPKGPGTYGSKRGRPPKKSTGNPYGGVDEKLNQAWEKKGRTPAKKKAPAKKKTQSNTANRRKAAANKRAKAPTLRADASKRIVRGAAKNAGKSTGLRATGRALIGRGPLGTALGAAMIGGSLLYELNKSTPAGTRKGNNPRTNRSSGKVKTVRTKNQRGQPVRRSVASAPKPASKKSAPSKKSATSSFGAAFRAARKAHGGAGGVFTYKGKKYQTNIKGEAYVKNPKKIKGHYKAKGK
jgi:hypothetical protein